MPKLVAVRGWSWTILLGALLTLPASAGEPWLIRGTSRGELTVHPQLPKIPWSLRGGPDEFGSWRGEVELSLPDTAVHASLRWPGNGDVGEWQFHPVQLDLAAGWTWLAPVLGPALAQWGVEGEMTAEGAGKLGDVGEGAMTGQAVIHRLQIPEPAVVVSDGRLDVRAQGEGDPTAWPWQAQVQAREVTASALVLTEVAGELEGSANGAVRIRRLTARALGGRVESDLIQWQPGQTEVRVALHLIDVDLAVLAELLPAVLRQASGRVSGRVLLRWRDGPGFEAIGGDLRSAADAPVQVRLAPRPGFLTQKLSRRIGWAFLSIENPVFETLRAVELGRATLDVAEFGVELFPPDDPLGRTARVYLEGKPTDGQDVKKVTLTVNVAGPLADLLRAGLSGRIEVH